MYEVWRPLPMSAGSKYHVASFISQSWTLLSEVTGYPRKWLPKTNWLFKTSPFFVCPLCFSWLLSVLTCNWIKRNLKLLVAKVTCCPRSCVKMPRVCVFRDITDLLCFETGVQTKVMVISKAVCIISETWQGKSCITCLYSNIAYIRTHIFSGANTSTNLLYLTSVPRPQASAIGTWNISTAKYYLLCS